MNGTPIFDVSINLGNLLTIGTFIIGGITFLLTSRESIRILGVKVDATDSANDDRFLRIEAQTEDFKHEMQKLSDIMLQLARTTGRQDLTDERLLMQGKRIDANSILINELSGEIRQMLRDKNG